MLTFQHTRSFILSDTAVYTRCAINNTRVECIFLIFLSRLLIYTSCNIKKEDIDTFDVYFNLRYRLFIILDVTIFFRFNSLKYSLYNFHFFSILSTKMTKWNRDVILMSIFVFVYPTYVLYWLYKDLTPKKIRYCLVLEWEA